MTRILQLGIVARRSDKSGKTHCYIILIARVYLIQNYMTRDWMFLGMYNARTTAIISDGQQTAENKKQRTNSCVSII